MVGTTAALPLKFGGRISDPPGIGEPVPPPTSYRSVRHHVTTATIGPSFFFFFFLPHRFLLPGRRWFRHGFGGLSRNLSAVNIRHDRTGRASVQRTCSAKNVMKGV